MGGSEEHWAETSAAQTPAWPARGGAAEERYAPAVSVVEPPWQRPGSQASGRRSWKPGPSTRAPWERSRQLLGESAWTSALQPREPSGASPPWPRRREGTPGTLPQGGAARGRSTLRRRSRSQESLRPLDRPQAWPAGQRQGEEQRQGISRSRSRRKRRQEGQRQGPRPEARFAAVLFPAEAAAQGRPRCRPWLRSTPHQPPSKW